MIMSALQASPTWHSQRQSKKCAGNSWVTTINNHVLTFRSKVGQIWQKRRLLRVVIRTLDAPLIEQSHDWTPALRVRLPAANEFFRFTIWYVEGQRGRPAKHYEWGADAIHKRASLNGKDAASLNLNVWILMFDGVSLANYMRAMPISRRLLRQYGALEMTGHTVSGCNTAQNVWPLITGYRANDERFKCAWKHSNCTTQRYVDDFSTLWAAYKSTSPSGAMNGQAWTSLTTFPTVS